MKALVFGFALLATPALDLPKLGQPVGDMPNWFNDSDWTSSRASGSVRFKVVFNTDGFPDTCVIEATSGNKDVERLACSTIKKRFRFKPSLDADGVPVSRVFIRSVAMGGPPPEDIRPSALFSVTVDGYKNVKSMSVILDVNKDGALMACSNTYKKDQFEALDRDVCQSLTKLWKPLLEVDATGAAIRYVREVSIDIKHAP